MERVKYVSYDEKSGDLVVQLTGGGAMQRIKRGDTIDDAVGALRELALLLERGAEFRQERV